MKNQITNVGNLVAAPPHQPLVNKLPGGWLPVALAAVMLLGALQPATGVILGPAFTYHGRLQSSAVPANGHYDLTFLLYTNGTSGSAVAGPLTNTYIAVNDGVFTARLDFGDGVFDGTAYWLEIGVRTNGDGDFTTLSPRHELLATPYAVYAENARSVGTTDSQPLDFYADNVRALRLVLRTDATGIYSNAPDVIGGSAINFVKTGVVGGTVGGGGGYDTSGNLFPNRINANFGTVSGGIGNVANGPGSFIGGGGTDGTGIVSGNNAGGSASVIGGGLGNTNNGYASTIGGGFQNSANSTTSGFFYGGATVGGGTGNKATTDQATVGGGILNAASGIAATVPGGSDNVAGGANSFAAGQSAQTTHDGTFIWGDGSQIPFKGVNADNAFNVLASGGVFFYNGTNGLHIDALGNNYGTLDFGLRFGGAPDTGEGIASQRVAGGNQYGLDFYTASANRMSIAVNGFVGINTSSPSERLEVNGNYVLIDGNKAANGNGQIEAYIGGDGGGSDVQIGSMNSAITAVGFWNRAAGAWMHIACSSITINGGADLAEPFPMTTTANQVLPGAVVVIDEQHPGQVKLSDQPYDARVAGVVSGANGINPGIQMQQQGLLEGGKNVALTGRVYVQADASNGSISPGDLLTTSSIPGRAMKVTDHAKAQGAILGKAMTGLSDGNGMVLVLVTLQ